MSADVPVVTRHDETFAVTIAPGVTISWWFRGRVCNVKLECGDSAKCFILADDDIIPETRTLQ